MINAPAQPQAVFALLSGGIQRQHQLDAGPGIELVLPLDPAGEQGEDCLRLRWSIDQEAQLQLEINDLRSGRTWSQPTLGAVR